MGTDISTGFGAATDAAGMWAVNPNNITANSQEQVFSPVRITRGAWGSSGSISGFGVPYWNWKEYGAFASNKLGPTRMELDPYFSTIDGSNGSNWIRECDYVIVTNNGYGSNGQDLNIRKTSRRSISTVTTSALRGPLMLSGWGFDMADRPVPSQNPSGGFTFDSNAVGDRSRWKSGPVNLMWDEQRQLWRGGHQIVCGVVQGKVTAPITPCQPTTFTMKVFRLPSGFDGFTGDLTTQALGETVIVTNRDPSLEQVALSGMIFCIAVDVNYEWLPLWVGCPTGLPSTQECTGDGSSGGGGGDPDPDPGGPSPEPPLPPAP